MLEDVFVLPEHRRGGLASALLARAQDGPAGPLAHLRRRHDRLLPGARLRLMPKDAFPEPLASPTEPKRNGRGHRSQPQRLPLVPNLTCRAAPNDNPPTPSGGSATEPEDSSYVSQPPPLARHGRRRARRARPRAAGEVAPSSLGDRPLPVARPRASGRLSRMLERRVAVHVDGLTLSGEALVPDDPSMLCVLCHGIPSGAPRDPADPGYGGLARTLADRTDSRRSGSTSAACAARRASSPSRVGAPTSKRRSTRSTPTRRSAAIPRVVVGSSAGGASRIAVAARREDVVAVATYAAPASFTFGGLVSDPRRLVQTFRNTGIIHDPAFPSDIDAWWGEFAAIAPEDVIGKIAPRPVLLVHGDSDDVIPYPHAERLFLAAGEPKELVRIPRGAHQLRRDPRAVEALDRLAREPPGFARVRFAASDSPGPFSFSGVKHLRRAADRTLRGGTDLVGACLASFLEGESDGRRSYALCASWARRTYSRAPSRRRKDRSRFASAARAAASGSSATAGCCRGARPFRSSRRSRSRKPGSNASRADRSARQIREGRRSRNPLLPCLPLGVTVLRNSMAAGLPAAVSLVRPDPRHDDRFARHFEGGKQFARDRQVVQRREGLRLHLS